MRKIVQTVYTPLCCMFFAYFSGNYHPIVMLFGKLYFLVFRQLFSRKTTI